MTDLEIIKKAKYYFGKDRTPLKDLILSYKFDGSSLRRLNKDIKSIISNPNRIYFGIFDDIIIHISENTINEIDWNWIGDLSWTIEIVLNPDITRAYDWDKTLTKKCNGTARILTFYISEIVPCFTYDIHYMTYNKKNNYWELGPINCITREEKDILDQLVNYFETRKLRYVNKELSIRKIKQLFSDTNSDGNASLFDVLFSDTTFYHTEIVRFSDKEVLEKSGTKFHWKEYYNQKGILEERIESRWTKCGDYYSVILDGKSQINKIEVMRKEIGEEKYQSFKLDLLKAYKQKLARKKRKAM